MSDVMTPAQRSHLMSRVRTTGTKPEMAVRKALWHEGFRYRVNTKLPGSPDIVFPGPQIAVFVDGCFWHSCPTHGAVPQTNTAFWKDKLKVNRKRDKRVSAELREEGWTVLRFWEHEIKHDVESVLDEVRSYLV